MISSELEIIGFFIAHKKPDKGKETDMVENSRRIRILSGILSLIILGLVGRMAFLQLFSSDKLAQTAAKRQTQLIPGEDIPRGNILDRSGISLTDSGASSTVIVFPSMLRDPDDASEKLAGVLGTSPGVIKAKMRNKQQAFFPNLSPGELKGIIDLKIYGVYPAQVQTRYGKGSLARHVVGHVNSIDAASWAALSGKKDNKDSDYSINDNIGVKGIEGLYEEYLHASDPSFFLTAVMDGRGNVIPGLSLEKVKGSVKATQRNDLWLTINSKLQQKVEETMDAHIQRGAVVVMDVKTGDILAVASRPNYNQNLIADYLDTSSGKEAFNNRAFEFFYPGSVFKVLVASAVLEENLVKPEEKFLCTGKYTLNTGLSIGCWETKGHEALNFIEGFANSCNPVFIEAGLRLGRDKILDYGDKFGLLQPEIIGYPQPDHKCLSIKPFGDGQIANASLGQEGVMISPVQVAGMISVVANGGYYQTPRLVMKITNPQGRILKTFPSDSPKQVLNPDTAKKVQAMLAETVINGTGKNAWVPVAGSAGKTGSAETGRTDSNGKSIKNVWFAGYVPLKSPRFAIVVMKQEGSSGGGDAAPVFKEIGEYAVNNL